MLHTKKFSCCFILKSKKRQAVMYLYICVYFERVDFCCQNSLTFSSFFQQNMLMCHMKDDPKCLKFSILMMNISHRGRNTNPNNRNNDRAPQHIVCTNENWIERLLLSGQICTYFNLHRVWLISNNNVL